MLAVMRRVLAGVRRQGLAVALCALVAHAAAYRTLWPSDGAHGYLAWYQPLVAGLSLAAIVALLLLLGIALIADRLGRSLDVRGVGPASRPLSASAAQIGGWAFVFFLVQESLERSVESGVPAFAAFTPSELLAVLVSAAFAALVVALVAHVGRAVVARVLGRSGRVVGQRSPVGWSVVTGEKRLPRPLAVHSALRAPPLAP
jgi:hypothetical protein